MCVIVCDVCVCVCSFVLGCLRLSVCAVDVFTLLYDCIVCVLCCDVVML